MAEPVWYYARGEVERGPFTIVQIKALASAGRLRRDDLVWKEGMENWTSAADVAELFPTGTTEIDEKVSLETSSQPIAPVVRVRTTGPQSSPIGVRREVAALFVTVGRSCLFVGLFAIVLAKGCESLGERKVSRHDAAVKMQAIDTWQKQRAPLSKEMATLQSKPRPTATDQDRLRDITQTLKLIDHAFVAQELTADQRLTLNRATAELREGAFVRGLAFHGGVLFLLLSGFLLALVASGTDRWLGVGVLLLVCFATLSQ